jgi:serine/threonine-protein kinase PpkA
MGVIYLHGNAPLPQLDGELRAYQPLLDRLLAKDPADRFANARALIQAIAELA